MRTQHPFTHIYRIRDKRTGEFMRNWSTGTTVWLSRGTAERSLIKQIWSGEARSHYEIVEFEVKEIPDEQERTDEPTHQRPASL